MKKYIKCVDTLEDYILSKEFIDEIKQDTYKVLTKLDRVDAAYTDKYGKANTHIQEIVRTVESSIDRLDSILKNKLDSATNTCGMSAKVDVDEDEVE